MSEVLPPSSPHWVDVVVTTPAHSGLGDSLTYESAQALAPGTLVRVPLGPRETLGIVWAAHETSPDGLDARQCRPVAQVLDTLPPLNDHWRTLVAFAARYYQRSLGEVALAALPPALRDLQPEQLIRRLKKQERWATGASAAPADLPARPRFASPPSSQRSLPAGWRWYWCRRLVSRRRPRRAFGRALALPSLCCIPASPTASASPPGSPRATDVLVC